MSWHCARSSRKNLFRRGTKVSMGGLLTKLCKIKFDAKCMNGKRARCCWFLEGTKTIIYWSSQRIILWWNINNLLLGIPFFFLFLYSILYPIFHHRWSATLPPFRKWSFWHDLGSVQVLCQCAWGDRVSESKYIGKVWAKMFDTLPL